MTGPSIDNRISLGNILVAGSMVVGIALAWGNLSGRTDSIAVKLSETTAITAAHEARLRALETSSARQDERMMLILDGLRKIEARLERDQAGR